MGKSCKKIVLLLCTLFALGTLAGAVPSWAAPSLCTVTGTVYKADGTTFANGKLYFRPTVVQTYGADTVSIPAITVALDGSGNIPAGTQFPQGERMLVSVGSSSAIAVTIPSGGSCPTTFGSMYGAVQVPPPATVVTALAVAGDTGLSVTNPSGSGTATITFGPALAGIHTDGSDRISSFSVNGILNVAVYAGADFSVKANACLAALPAGGGICDARQLTGAQSISTSVLIGTGQVLLLGSATYTSTVTPAFKITGNNGSLIGMVNAIDPQNYGQSMIVLSGTVGGSAIQIASTSTAGDTIRNLFVLGLSTTDGSIGIDATYAASARIEDNRVQNFQTGIKVGGTGSCACYNNFSGNQVITAAIGVDFNTTANKNTWGGGGNVQPFGTGSIGFRFGSTAVGNVIVSPDVENFASGIALDFFGEGNLVLGAYVEAGGTVVKFESGANQNVVLGGSTASIGTLVTDSSGNQTNIAYLNDVGPGGTPQWPLYWGMRNLRFSTAQQDNLDMVPDATLSLGVDLLWGAFWNGQGYTGAAPLTLGSINARGGAALSGRVALTANADPGAPTITNVGTAGSTSYTYFVVCKDYNGGVSNVSPGGTTTTGNATLSATNYNHIVWNCNPQGTYGNGYFSADILKTNSSTSLALNQAPGSSINDTGQATSAYTAPARNTTGDLVAAKITGLAAPGATGQALAEGNPIGAITPAAGTFTAVTNQCGGTVTLAAGAGTFSNACVTTASKCTANDQTAANAVKVAAPGAGSVALAGTGTDVVLVACQ